MSGSGNKLFVIGIIFARLVFCLVISLGIYLISTIFVYAAWHCPAGNCETATWSNLIIFAIFASPFPIFIFGAYFSRHSIYALTENAIARFLIFMVFACFPLLLLVAFITYAVNSTN